MSPIRFRQAAALAVLALLAAPATAQIARDFSTDPAAAPAGSYKIDPSHTSVTARVVHLGLSNFAMRFTPSGGVLDFDPKDPARSHLDVSIDPHSIDTGVPALDQEVLAHGLKSSDTPFHFVSTRIERTGPNTGRITGDLTFDGTTRPVTLDATFNGTGVFPGGSKHRLGFSAKAELKRSDFGMTAFSPFVSDEVKLQIETEFSQ